MSPANAGGHRDSHRSTQERTVRAGYAGGWAPVRRPAELNAHSGLRGAGYWGAYEKYPGGTGLRVETGVEGRQKVNLGQELNVLGSEKITVTRM